MFKSADRHKGRPPKQRRASAQMGEITMKKVPELFGSMVFNEAVMKERLPKDVYKSLKQTVRQGTALDGHHCRKA